MKRGVAVVAFCMLFSSAWSFELYDSYRSCITYKQWYVIENRTDTDVVVNDDVGTYTISANCEWSIPANAESVTVGPGYVVTKDGVTGHLVIVKDN